jgi:putative tricarboxylic transport membrane protein
VGFAATATEFVQLLHPSTLALASAGMALGILLGALPGLGATVGMGLLMGVIFSISTTNTLVLLLCVYVGAIYGASLSAILINIPGSSAAIATNLDGYPLAVKGEAGLAIGTAAVSSFLGTIIGLLALLLLSPMIASMALQFTSPELALLAILGIMVCGSISATDLPIKGWIAGVLGILLSTIGIDVINQYPRFVYGNPNLFSGFSIIPAMIGLFGISQMIDTLRSSTWPSVTRLPRVVPQVREVLSHWRTILRSSAVGTGIGAVPGVGENIAALLSYDLAKRASKRKEEFGKGSYEGLVAAETANNACVPGAHIPLLTLGIPGSPTTAVLLGALILHGVRPGPLLLTENPAFFYQIVAIFFLAALLLMALALLLARPMSKMLEVPPSVLLPVVSVFAVTGAYAMNLNLFDVYIMLAFGVIGWVLKQLEYPLAAVVLGMILGPIVDENLRRSFMVSEGAFWELLARPVALLLLLGIVLSVLSQSGFVRTRIAALLAGRKAHDPAG